MEAIQPSYILHLRNWSIGAKLAASFGLIILVTIGLAATSLFSLLSVRHTLDKALNEGLQIEALGSRIQDRLSGARRQEQAFLLQWQALGYQNATYLYLMPRGSYIADIRRAITRLENLTADEQTEFSVGINARARQLMDALDTYDTEFNLVTDLLMDRGTNQSGAIGDLETVSLEFAAELENLGQLELLNIFLQLRLNEERYRLLGEKQYSEKMSLALQELRASLVRVAPTESVRLILLLDRYEQAFDELNRLDAEIASHIDHYNAAAEAIHSLAFNIAADGSELADEELNSVAQSVHHAFTAGVLAIVVAVALSIVLSIVLTRQIGQPIRVLTDTAMEIEHGNLAARAHVESGGEIGMLATVFNSMTAQLRQTLEGLEQRVAERTTELTVANEQLQREIVERRRAEEQLQRYAAELEQANEEVKQFAYIVSHDLRGPLTNLKGFSEELSYALEVIGSAMDKALPHLDEKQRQAVTVAFEEDVPEALGFINSSVTRMDHFINAVLKLSRLGRRELKFEPVDMEALVQAALQTLGHQIEERHVKVSVGPLPAVVADRTSMEQILGNLLGNAVKYLNPDRPGEIGVTGECDHDETIFRVRDSGRGIAEEDMDKVFAPFRRAGKQDVPGEGMGLPYVQTLVRRHGGRIWCESQPGKGSTFYFTIPAKPKA
jgi:signal transduction histidine kinase